MATAIGICAEFGADYLKPHKKGIIDCLRTALEQPNAKNLDNIMAYEAAVSTCGKLNQFLSEDIYTYEVLSYYYYYVPKTSSTGTHNKDSSQIYNFSRL